VYIRKRSDDYGNGDLSVFWTFNVRSRNEVIETIEFGRNVFFLFVVIELERKFKMSEKVEILSHHSEINLFKPI
jgi:hypothetical protein